MNPDTLSLDTSGSLSYSHAFALENSPLPDLSL